MRRQRPRYQVEVGRQSHSGSDDMMHSSAGAEAGMYQQHQDNTIVRTLAYNVDRR